MNNYYKFKQLIKGKSPRFYFFLRWCLQKLFFFRSIMWEKKMPGFYAQFINQGDLCFDIGAHVGLITGVFLKIGAKVVSVEPHPLFCQSIATKYANNSNLTVINKGVAHMSGNKTLTIIDGYESLSTMSEKWKAEGRFSEEYKVKPTRNVSVNVISMDDLIEKYGVPVFCKIDVEGFEKEVLSGLHQPIRYISFEFIQEFMDDAKWCADHLSSLGRATFNFSQGDSLKFLFKDWVSSMELFNALEEMGKKDLWGDIYVKTL